MSDGLYFSESSALRSTAGERRAWMVRSGAVIRSGALPALFITAPHVHDRSRLDNKLLCPAQQDIYIDQSVHLECSIETRGNIYVMGAVEGGTLNGNYMFVGLGGQVDGNVSFNSADVYGRVAGRLTVSGNLTLYGSAEVDADVTCGNIEILAGGRLNGRILTATEYDVPLAHRNSDKQFLRHLLSAAPAAPSGRWRQFCAGCVCGGFAAAIAALLIQ